MARGEPSRPGPRPGSPLPAPYRSPWRGLAEALRAVAADLRLALRRLWRRNREGELARPGFWPEGLAFLFWPLLLGAALVLLVALGSWLLGLKLASGAAPAVASGRAAAGAGTNSAGRPALVEPTALPGRPGLGVDRQPAPGPEVAASTPGPPERTDAVAGAEPQNTGTRQPPQPSAAGADQATAELRLDPLLELLSQGEDAGMLLEARPDPAASRLTLTLSDRAAALPQGALLEHAQRLSLIHI